VATFGERRLDSIRPAELEAFIRARPGWADGTRRGSFSVAGTLLRWAREAGYLEYNPLAGSDNPWPAPSRQRGMTDLEFRRLVGGVADPELRLVLRVLRATGCRPGEAYALEARHLDPLRPVATLGPHEHKTGGRTGRDRPLYFPAGLMAELRTQAARFPEGPILRNTKGRPWTVYNVCQRFRLYRQRLGLAKEVVPYALRHAFITDMVHAGADAALLAKMVGHSGTATLHSVYFHGDEVRMAEMAERRGGLSGGSAASPSGSAPPPPSGSGTPGTPAAPGPTPENPSSPPPSAPPPARRRR
jgi:integrase